MRRKATRIEHIIAAAARSGDRAYVRVGRPSPVAELWIDGPTLVAATAEGGDHRLGARLVSTGHIAAAELERSRTAASDRGISLALTLAGRVRRDVIAAVARDEARYALAAALAAPDEDIGTTDGSGPEHLFPLAIDVTDLLAETKRFLDAVREARDDAPPSATPVAADAPSPDLALGPEEWALLSRADGTATIATLADECGFPQPEASLIVARLHSMGLVTIESGYSEAADLMAELEAAQDLAAVSAAFEHATVVHHDEPSAPEPEFAVHEPIAEAEPAFDLEVEQRAAEIPGVHGDRTVDTQSLLRELSSIARVPADGR